MVKDFILEALMGDATQKQRFLIWRTIILSAFTAHILWSVGIWFPGAEAGFINKKQFNTLKEQVQRVEINQLTAKIEIAQERVCKAIKDKNYDAQRYAVTQRNIHIREYRELTNENPITPTCEELGLILDANTN